MTKKDFVIKEDIERGKENTEKEGKQVEHKAEGKTEVKNASATGLGAMGRNDQESNEQTTGNNE
jgi:hypothetical protein